MVAAAPRTSSPIVIIGAALPLAAAAAAAAAAGEATIAEAGGLLLVAAVGVVVVELLKVVISTPPTSIAHSVVGRLFVIVFCFLVCMRAANAMGLSCPFGGGSLAFHSASVLRPVRIAPLRGHLFAPPFALSILLVSSRQDKRSPRERGKISILGN